jgi:prepilin-type processing-associated H-X9-DG protein
MQRHRFFAVLLSICACMTLLVRGHGQGTLPAGTDQVSNSNLKQIGLALLMYSQDFDEKLPPMRSAAGVKKAISPYIRNAAVFIQPGTKQPYRPNTFLSHRSVATFKTPASMMAFFEASPASDGTRGVLFLDGHVKRFPEAAWPALRRASHIPGKG